MVSSEVLEHVLAPVEAALGNVCSLLKPAGVLVFTVPYAVDGETVEHFGPLHDFGLARLSDRTVLVNRTPSGEMQVFDHLVFHGGRGSTLEMREFSEPGLKCALRGAGFSEVRIDSEDHPEFGIVRRNAWSLPIAARKGPFAWGRDPVRELVGQNHDANRRIEGLLRSVAVRIAIKLRLL